MGKGSIATSFTTRITITAIVVIAVSILAVIPAGCSPATSDKEVESRGARSVAELVDSPRYDEEIITYGTISKLDETTHSYFELTSRGATIRVWFDLKVDADGNQEPPADVAGVLNGNRAVVRGELKGSAGKYHEKGDFWAAEVCVPCVIPGGQWIE
jgi:hypothetical protein